MLRGLLDDISKDEGVYANPNKRIKTTGSLRAPGAPVKPKPVPALLRLPAEVRSRIYDFLIPDTKITLHYHRRIEDYIVPVGCESTPPSAGHVYQHFRLPAMVPYGAHEWDEYSVLANGAYGITLASRLLRSESFVRVLQSATFRCDDDVTAAHVFTRHFPALWRPHLQHFAGWMEKMRSRYYAPAPAPTDSGITNTCDGLGALHPSFPTDPGHFPNLRSVQLNVPGEVYDNSPSPYFELDEFKAASKKRLVKAMLTPVVRVALREGSVDVVNAFMLVSTLHELEWVVRRKILVAFVHEPEDMAQHVFERPVRKAEFCWFVLEYNSKTGKLTRSLKEEDFKTNYHKGGIPDEEVRKRWTVAEEIA